MIELSDIATALIDAIGVVLFLLMCAGAVYSVIEKVRR